MLTLNASVAIAGCWANGETRTLPQTSPCDIPRVNFLISAAAHSSLRSSCKQTIHLLSSFSKCSRPKSHYLSRKSNRRTVTQLVRHVHICASSDDEYRSSRNIAVSLFRRYRNVIDRGGAENLKEFISAGVNAYALGCTDEGLRKELKNMMDSGVDIEEIQTYGGSTSLKSKIFSEECICLASFVVYVHISWIMPLAFPQPCHRATLRLGFRLPFHGHAAKLPCDWDLPTNCGIPASLWGLPPVAVDECILWLSIIFITILCTPQPTVVRWSSTAPVSAEIMLQWKGFCALIANAYYMRGMAWLPVKTLQLEQMAVQGSAEEPSVVASRMQLVFSTLEVVSPQWPRV